MGFIEYVLKYFGYVKESTDTKNENEKSLVLTCENVPVKISPVSPSSFAIMPGTGGDIINFYNCGDVIPEGYYCCAMEKSSREGLYNALSVGVGAASFGAATVPLTGLYKATAPISQHMKLSSGGVSSAMVGENGKIAAQAGFVKAGASSFTPLVAFQLMSMVTGQYYLNGINKQLKVIEAKLDDIMKDLEAEKQAKLNSAAVLFHMMTAQSSFSLDDIVLTRDKMAQMLELYFFYTIRMQEEYDSVIHKKEQISKWTNCGDVEELKSVLKGTKFFDYYTKAQYCCQVYRFGELLYLKMLAFSMETDPLALKKIEEIVSSFKDDSHNLLNTTFKRHSALFGELQSVTLDYVKAKSDDATYFKGSLDKAANWISSNLVNEQAIQDNEGIREISAMQKQVLSYIEQPVEMLYRCSGDGEVFVYCKEDQNTQN